jgi:pimeloyl-ACP methyl ester carboxylesterase
MALLYQKLPEGIKSATLAIRDLDMHVLYAGQKSAPLLLLLHGFPELAFSWRRIMLPLTALGYFVVAPDQRGYGRTTPHASHGKPVAYEDSIVPYRMLNLVHDIVALVNGLGYSEAAAVVGHDFGSLVAAHSALIRPDMFKSVVCMSAPYPGQPPYPPVLGEDRQPAPSKGNSGWAMLNRHLSALHPPMKHYTTYFSNPDANADMQNAPQGLQAFLRAYWHMKSADWPGNSPHQLGDVSQLLKLPHYYVMPMYQTMPEAVEAHAPSQSEVLHNRWLPDDELAIYAEEFGRTGFQGGLNWYRALNNTTHTEELGVFAGKQIEVPAMFVGGAKDWGVYQMPGALDKMKHVCTQFAGTVLVEGAGHWVQQESPDAVLGALHDFLLGNVRGEMSSIC